MPGGIEFTRALVAAGHRVSLGHSGATYDQAMAGVAAGARHATHLFNRMTPLGHREPGLAGAVLRAEEIAAEIICDGHHVHPATARLAIDVKRPTRVMAITDGTAGVRPAGRLQGDDWRAADHRHHHRGVSRRWHAGGEHVDDGRGVQDAGEHVGVQRRRGRCDVRDDAGERAEAGGAGSDRRRALSPIWRSSTST